MLNSQSTFKVRLLLNAVLNVDLIAWYSGWICSNAELNVEPITRYSNCVIFWMQSWTSISQLNIQDVGFRMQSWMSNPLLDIQIVYYIECRAEHRSHSSIFKMYVFECRTECRTDRSIFQVCIILNAELNIDLTTRNSGWMFSNAELNVEPIALYLKCVCCWMQKCTSIS